MNLERGALAQAVHHYYCLEKEAPDHTPDQDDFDKADEILEILELLEEPA